MNWNHHTSTPAPTPLCAVFEPQVALLSSGMLEADQMEAVHEHLADGGLFIFDVNTAGRLRRLHGAPPYLDEFDGNVVVMTVRSAAGSLSLWQTRIFERQHDDVYRLHDERIYELGVPLIQIRAALAGRFELLEEASLDGSPVSDESDRIFFVYRHRPASTRPPGF